MTGDFAQDTSLNMSAAAQPPASLNPLTTATGSPSNGSPSRLTPSISRGMIASFHKQRINADFFRNTPSVSRGMIASFPVDASGLRARVSPPIAVIPSFSSPRNHGATT